MAGIYFSQVASHNESEFWASCYSFYSSLNFIRSNKNSSHTTHAWTKWNNLIIPHCFKGRIEPNSVAAAKGNETYFFCDFYCCVNCEAVMQAMCTEWLDLTVINANNWIHFKLWLKFRSFSPSCRVELIVFESNFSEYYGENSSRAIKDTIAAWVIFMIWPTQPEQSTERN